MSWDKEAIEFLQWALPRMELRWRGFRKVRGQVKKRLRVRLGQLGLQDLGAYREFLETDDREWVWLDEACRITISRFYRDRGVFDKIVHELLDTLVKAASRRKEDRVVAWSLGAASGEEAYTLILAWRFRDRQTTDLGFEVVALESQGSMIERIERAQYPLSSLKDLPASWVTRGFVVENGIYTLREELREGVRALQGDLRESLPSGHADLVCCRNLAFTYFNAQSQGRVLSRILERLRPGGFLVLGVHEGLPVCPDGLREVGPSCYQWRPSQNQES